MSSPSLLLSDASVVAESSDIRPAPVNDSTKPEENAEVTKVNLVQNPEEGQSDSDESNSTTSAGRDNEDNEDEPSTSAQPTEEVDSKRRANQPRSAKKVSSKKQTTSTQKRPLKRKQTTRKQTTPLKRSRSRASTPRKRVAEEIDSATPRSSRRNQKRRMTALFLDTDFPRKK